MVNSNIWNSEKLKIFKSNVLKLNRFTVWSIFCCHDPIGVNLLARPRLGLSHHANTTSQSTLQLWHHFLLSFWKTNLLNVKNISSNILVNTSSKITMFVDNFCHFTLNDNFFVLLVFNFLLYLPGMIAYFYLLNVSFYIDFAWMFTIGRKSTRMVRECVFGRLKGDIVALGEIWTLNANGLTMLHSRSILHNFYEICK